MSRKIRLIIAGIAVTLLSAGGLAGYECVVGFPRTYDGKRVHRITKWFHYSPSVSLLYRRSAIYYAYKGDYDAVVAMYHDQGLVPLKMIGFDTGINWTLGLPFIRTSPDHGTAYDIAGKGIANPSSMMAAIRLAKQLAIRQ